MERTELETQNSTSILSNGPSTSSKSSPSTSINSRWKTKKYKEEAMKQTKLEKQVEKMLSKYEFTNILQPATYDQRKGLADEIISLVKYLIKERKQNAQ